MAIVGSLVIRGGVQQNEVVIDHRQIPLLDLASQHSPIRDELLAAIVRVLDSQKFILGEDVARLEQEIAAYVGTPHAIACASGSDALSLALWALDIQPGDEVLTTPFTFFATAGSISRVGARPVFLDIEPATFNMDMNRVEEALQAHPRVRAIIPVHLFGGCADMNSLAILAEKRGISIIEDAAQAIGSECTGKRAGSLGVIGCFSFYPTKNLGGYGDGGMVVTNHRRLYEKLRLLRCYGEKKKYEHHLKGGNSRLDELQAAILRVKLNYLDRWNEERREKATLYSQRLASSGVVRPLERRGARHVYYLYVIRTRKRDSLQAFLKQRGIETLIHYPIPIHQQRAFKELGYRRGDLPLTEQCSRKILSLPFFPGITESEMEEVANGIQDFVDTLVSAPGSSDRSQGRRTRRRSVID